MNPYLTQLSIPYQDYLSQYDWDMWGTLTPPYTMSLASVERAMERLEKIIGKELPCGRIFWTSERFEGKGYHIHFLATFICPTMTFTKKSKIVSKCWEQSVAAHRRPITKITKFKKNQNAIEYILKKKLGYGFLGDSWQLGDTI